MGLRMACILMAMALAPAASSARPPGAAGSGIMDSFPDRTSVNWTRGLITASAAATGDLRAPSPAVARVAATRLARERAAFRLSERARALYYRGKTLAQLAAADPAIAERLSRALEHVIELRVEYGSDGSVVMAAGLPLEALRLAITGIPAPPPAPADGPTALIVDARGVLARPAFGVDLGSGLGSGPGSGPVSGPSNSGSTGPGTGEARYQGPVVFSRGLKGARTDPRLGARVATLRAQAVSTDGNGLELPDDASETLGAARRAGALVIIVIGKAP